MNNEFEVKKSENDPWQILYLSVRDRIRIGQNEHQYHNKNYEELEEKNDFTITQSKTEKEEVYFVLHVQNVAKNYHYQVRSADRIVLEHIVYHVLT